MFLNPKGSRALLSAFLAVSVGVLAVGCSDDDGGPMAPATGSVTVHFDHQAGGVPLTSGDLDGNDFAYENAAGNQYSIEKLRYFVSDIQFRRTNGTTYGVDDYHYRDVSLDETRSYTIAGVPAGTYDAISFTFGLDPTKNVPGPPINQDPNTLGMGWPDNWGGGWHYMILEGFHNAADPVSYKTHTGRRYITTPGPNDPPDAPDIVPYNHHFEVTLPLPTTFHLDGDNWEVRVIMEINGWYEDPLFDFQAFFPTGTEGIMVNLTAQAMLQQNGPGCFSVTSAVKK